MIYLESAMSVFNLEPTKAKNPVQSRVMYVHHEGLIQYLHSSGAVADWISEMGPADCGYDSKDGCKDRASGVYVDEGYIASYRGYEDTYDEATFEVTSTRLATQDEWRAFLNGEYVFEDEYQASLKDL